MIKMGFKFLNNDPPLQPAHITRERFMELINHQPEIVGGIEYDMNQYHQRVYEPNPLSTDNRPAVFLQLHRDRDTISDDEWNHIIQQQRRNLIEHMWERGQIMHTIVSEDINGIVLRTEILF